MSKRKSIDDVVHSDKKQRTESDEINQLLLKANTVPLPDDIKVIKETTVTVVKDVKVSDDERSRVLSQALVQMLSDKIETKKLESAVLDLLSDDVKKQLGHVEETIDPLFDPKYKRDYIWPLQFPEVWTLMYKKEKAAFWVDEEVDLKDDLAHWEKLTKDEKYFITHILAFFSGSDSIVNDNLSSEGFVDKVTIKEWQFFYRFQEMMEDIHSQMYEKLLEAFVKDDKELSRLKNATTTIPAIKEKADWFKKWIRTGTKVERLLANVIVEGIFFSGSFCSIFWLRQRGIMPGLTHSNELISRDEGLHRDAGCVAYGQFIKNKLPVSVVIEMIREAVIVEKKFICESLPVRLIGMNSDLMSKYIEYVADHLALNLLEKRIYGTSNPFPWMVLISIPTKTNFFESRVSEYAFQQTLVEDETENEIEETDDF